MILALGLANPARAAAPKLSNAALRQYGARVSLSVGPGARADARTEPGDACDNNVHSRQVVTGVPYTFTIELPFRLPVDRLAFADSDYESEQAPKDLEIVVDDGVPLAHTLALQRPLKRKPVWQELPLGREAKVIKITVRSNHAPSEKVNWGGLGEIAVLTPLNLEEKFAVPGSEAKPVAFIHVPALAEGPSPRVRLPAPAQPGEHPRLLLTRAELAELRAALPRSERGQAALAILTNAAEGALAGAVRFPEPSGPMAQFRDRGDALAKEHSRLSQTAGTLGLACALTGDLRYGRRAAEIVLGYAARYEAYPEHKGANANDTGKVMAQRLSEAMWLIPLIESYDHLLGRGLLTAAERQQVEARLLRPAITFLWRREPAAEAADRDRRTPGWRAAAPAPGRGKTVGNWLNFYNTATLMAGAVLGDSNLVDVAVANFRTLLAEGIGADGMWGEGAIGYQMFALTAMVPGFEVAAHQGFDLWGFGQCRVKRLFDSPLRYAYPDGTAPGLHDSGRARFGNWSTMVYDYAWLRYGDPSYALLVNSSPRQLQMSEAVYFPTRVYEPLPEQAAAHYPSTLFGNLGYAILRQTNLYALLDYGPHGGVHGHLDKLNLVVFATGEGGRGDELGGEPVFHRYEDPLHRQWTCQTVAHNTLCVDELAQLSCTGQLLLFEDTPSVKVMRATALAAPGARLDRTVIVTGDALLDLYQGRSSFRRTWDRTFRYQGNLLRPSGGVPSQPLGRSDGYEHLRVRARLPAAELSRAAWQTPIGTLELTLAGAPSQELILAEGPDHDQMALARQQGEQVTFASVLALEPWRNPVQAAAFRPATDSNTVAFEMTQKDGTHTIVLLANGPTQPTTSSQALGWRTDARLLYVRRQGPTLTLLLAGGTFAQSEDPSAPLALRRPTPGTYLAELRAGKLELLSAWTPSLP